MLPSRYVGLSVALAALASAVSAQTPSGGVVALEPITVGRQLDEARNGLSPEIGTNTYRVDQRAIQNLTQGEDTPLNQVLLTTPGVAQDSKASGGIHVRGEHANVQYRLNGILLPEGLGGFAQNLDTRFVQEFRFLTGALPAQYGYRTAAVVDIETKSGFARPGGRAELYGGSFGTFQPSLSYGGSSGAVDYFATGSYRLTDLGIEAPTGSRDVRHDHLDEKKGFGYVSYQLPSKQDRLSLIVGTTDSAFEIPNRPGLDPVNTLASGDTIASRDLNQTQRERNHFGILAYQGTRAAIDYQVAYFTRFSTLHFRPDPIGDLVFNGVAPDVLRRSFTNGIQGDASWRATDRHTLRSGVFFSHERTDNRNTSRVFAGDGGVQDDLAGDPFTIIDNGSNAGRLYGLYLQDEWRLTPELTLNFGGRVDYVDAFRQEAQVSPRLNAVYAPTPTTTLHAGYARYFTPPPLELVAQGSIDRFLGTTAVSSESPTVNPAAKSERSNVFDVGVTQQIVPGLQIGAAAYYKNVSHLLDEGQFGAPVILTPFNYREGRIYGGELTASYTDERLTGYVNLGISKAEGKDIETGLAAFAQSDLDYIRSHFIPLDHDQRFTLSSGLAYRFGDTRVSAELLFGSGLTKDGDTPNGGRLPAYSTVNLGAGQHLGATWFGDLDLRLAIVNLFDEVYTLRDGTGIGVGAPQFGARRGVYGGIARSF